MQKDSPQFGILVWEKIEATAAMSAPDLAVLRNHSNAITKEFEQADAFQLIDGQWVLPDTFWNDWIQSGGPEHYIGERGKS